MAGFVALAVLLHVGRTAFRVGSAKTDHEHIAVADLDNGFIGWNAFDARYPFWPRFWRGLLGMPCTGRQFCETEGPPPGAPKRLLETCELEHPELRRYHLGNPLVLDTTPAQKDLLRRLQERNLARMAAFFDAL